MTDADQQGTAASGAGREPSFWCRFGCYTNGQCPHCHCSVCEAALAGEQEGGG